MSDRHEAGSGNKLAIVRSDDAREQSVQHERAAASNIYPGQAVAPGVDGETATYDFHGGDTQVADYHVAVEARGRGMDAQTSDGYPVDDEVKARDPSGAGGFNLRVAAGETVTETDAIIPDPAGTGDHLVYDSAVTEHAPENIVAHAIEDVDLSGASSPGLVAVDMQ